MSLYYKLLVISRGHQPENVYNLLAAARKRDLTLCTKVQRAIPIPTTYSPKKKAQNCWLTTLPAMCLSNTLQKMGIMTSTQLFSFEKTPRKMQAEMYMRLSYVQLSRLLPFKLDFCARGEMSMQNY